MYESFRYIYAPEYEHNPADVISSKYQSIDMLEPRFTVRTSGETQTFRVYDSQAAFLAHYETLDVSERLFHEVIFDLPQKLKFDIDAQLEKVEAFVLRADDDLGMLLSDITSPDIKYEYILKIIKQTIVEAFFTTYGIDLTDDDILVCHSNGPTKYSNHLIIRNYSVNNHQQAREFTNIVARMLSRAYLVFLDQGVNKRTQNFRMAGSHKGDGRIKQIVNGTLEETLIRNVAGTTRLPDLVHTATTARTSNIDEAVLQRVLAICATDPALDAFAFKCYKHGEYMFERIRESWCEFCERDHTHDSTLVVTANDEGTCVFKKCRHYLDTNGRDGNHIRVIGRAEGATTPTGARTSTDAHMQRILQCKTLPPPLPEMPEHRYDEPALAPFELVRTLIVHAPMKIGKTKALRDHIAAHFADGVQPSVIRFLSFRQTFSNNIKENFPNFTCYSDVTGPLTQYKLIVQIESLHRLEIRPGEEHPDLLVLDECESIFEQFESGLLRGRFNECFAKFAWLLAYSKYVICMDAFVTTRTYAILSRIRGDIAPGRFLYHYNVHKNAAHEKYYLCGDKLKWLGVLFAAVDSDERVAIPMNSVTEAKVLFEDLQRRYPAKSIKMYSAETPPSEKREHFSQVNLYWTNYDIIIYTPTISAGVSFEMKHFDKVFGYFTDMSCTAETCIQMLGRVRDIGAHETYLCISCTGNNLPTTRESIIAALYERREHIMREFDETGLSFEYGASGEIIYHDSPYFTVWVENMRIRNMSRNAFARRLVCNLNTTGAELLYLDDARFKELTGEDFIEDGDIGYYAASIESAQKDVRADVKEAQAAAIAEARDLTPPEVETICDKMAAHADITAEERHSFEKYKLRRDYKFDGEITAKFVSTYHDQRVRRNYKNLLRVFRAPTIEEALEQIHRAERTLYGRLVAAGESEHYRDLQTRYVFDQHRYALSLLRAAGWVHLTDKKYIHANQLVHNLAGQGGAIMKACAEFELPTPRLTSPNAAVKTISKILNIMYGVRIFARKSDPDMYCLSEITLFAASPGRPVPCIAAEPDGEFVDV